LEQARQLLTQGLPQMAPTVEGGLLAATGRWPLLLRLVNKILKNVAKTELDVSRTGAELCGRLQTGGAGAVDVLIGATSRDLKIDVPEERARAVRTMMAASTSLLDKQECSHPTAS